MFSVQVADELVKELSESESANGSDMVDHFISDLGFY